jgi:hypothetical protein
MAGCTIVDRDIGLRACAVMTAVDQDIDCKAALNEDGGGGDEELGKMHFQDVKCIVPRMLFLNVGMKE